MCTTLKIAKLGTFGSTFKSSSPTSSTVWLVLTVSSHQESSFYHAFGWQVRGEWYQLLHTSPTNVAACGMCSTPHLVEHRGPLPCSLRETVTSPPHQHHTIHGMVFVNCFREEGTWAPNVWCRLYLQSYLWPGNAQGCSRPETQSDITKRVKICISYRKIPAEEA